MDDAFLVRMPDHEGAVAAFQQLFEHDDLTGALMAASCHDVHGLVEHDLLTVLEFRDLDVWGDGHAQLSASGEDVDGAVVIAHEKHAVSARRLRESVDLLFERDHLVTSLSQRLGEALVPFAEARRAGLRFGQSIFQGADMTRRLRDLRSQQFDLLLEERRASTQISAGLIGAIG